MSKSFVSTLTKNLDETVKNWQYASLNDEIYPYLMVDVVYLKVCEADRVVSMSSHIAIDFSKEEHRKILGFLIQKRETDESWTHFFISLKVRGLNGSQMITSDTHKGLVTTIKKSFINTSWQRYQIHLEIC